MNELIQKIAQIVQDAPNGEILMTDIMEDLTPDEQRRALSAMKPGERAGLFQRRLEIVDGQGVVTVRTPEADAAWLAARQGVE